jgi:Cys-rich repeat protein
MDSDCQTSPNGAYCHRTDFVCVHCLDDTNCGTGQICDPLAGRCVGCQTSKDCHAPGLPLCDPATLTCVAKP